MAHTNTRELTGLKIAKSTAWEIADWLKALNWKPKRQTDRVRVWLRSINGPGDDRALFTVQDRDRLRSLVDAWLDLNRDARALLDLRSGRLPTADIAQIKSQLQSARAFWAFTKDGGLVPAWLDDTNLRPFDVAVALFIRIASDPDRWRLSAPCGNCGKYFVRERRRNQEKKYCGNCRRRESKHRMDKLRKEQKSEYLRLCRGAILEWEKHGGRDDWKTWTARYVGKEIERLRKNPLRLEIFTSKSLTRWVNSGELKPPRRKGKLGEDR